MNYAALRFMPRAFALSVVITLVAGCGTTGSPASPDASLGGVSAPPGDATEAPQGTPLETIDITITTGSAGMVWMPLWVTEAQGYFAEEGLNVEVVVAGGGAASLQALVTGASEFAATTMVNVMNARVSGADPVVLAPTLRQYATDFVIRADLADELGIDSDSPREDKIAALKGLRVGLASQGSPTDQLFQYLAREGGFDPDRDAERVFIGEGSAVLAAFEAGSIDAFSYGPPVSTQAVESGQGMFLFNIVEKIDLPELNDFPSVVLATTDGYLADNEDAVMRLARAYSKGVKFMATYPDAVPDVVRRGRFADLSDEVFEASYDASSSGFIDTPVVTEDDAEAMLEFTAAATGESLDLDAAEVVAPGVMEDAWAQIEEWEPEEPEG